MCARSSFHEKASIRPFSTRSPSSQPLKKDVSQESLGSTRNFMLAGGGGGLLGIAHEGLARCWVVPSTWGEGGVACPADTTAVFLFACGGLEVRFP